MPLKSLRTKTRSPSSSKNRNKKNLKKSRRKNNSNRRNSTSSNSIKRLNWNERNFKKKSDNKWKSLDSETWIRSKNNPILNCSKNIKRSSGNPSLKDRENRSIIYNNYDWNGRINPLIRTNMKTNWRKSLKITRSLTMRNMKKSDKRPRF